MIFKFEQLQQKIYNLFNNKTKNTYSGGALIRGGGSAN